MCGTRRFLYTNRGPVRKGQWIRISTNKGTDPHLREKPYIDRNTDGSELVNAMLKAQETRLDAI